MSKLVWYAHTGDRYELLPEHGPIEPRGDGAVVLDSHGQRWVRVLSKNRETHNWQNRDGVRCRFQDIDAESVLGEGVAS